MVFSQLSSRSPVQRKKKSLAVRALREIPSHGERRTPRATVGYGHGSPVAASYLLQTIVHPLSLHRHRILEVTRSPLLSLTTIAQHDWIGLQPRAVRAVFDEMRLKLSGLRQSRGIYRFFLLPSVACGWRIGSSRVTRSKWCRVCFHRLLQGCRLQELSKLQTSINYRDIFHLTWVAATARLIQYASYFRGDWGMNWSGLPRKITSFCLLVHYSKGKFRPQLWYINT
jgi:hypothetical protein